jgi:hypothetical protein
VSSYAKCKVVSSYAPSLWDAEYGCAPFLLATADIPADKILRLRPNLCLLGPPSPYKGRGRHPIHEAKFKFKDPATWSQPTYCFEMVDPALGRIQVQSWNNLHFRKAPGQSMIVARLERLESKGSRRLPKIIWLAWLGEEPPELQTWWQRYMRRYPVDHWYRFAKQRLYWTLPMFSTPEQGERWSDLMPLITWELWLARPIGRDKPLPWQKAQKEMTPGRVCQGMATFLQRLAHPPRCLNAEEMHRVGQKDAHADVAHASTWSKRAPGVPQTTFRRLENWIGKVRCFKLGLTELFVIV